MMHSLIQLQALVQAPDYVNIRCPWAIAERSPRSMIRLSGETTYSEIGSVFAQLAQYNGIEFTANQQAILLSTGQKLAKGG